MVLVPLQERHAGHAQGRCRAGICHPVPPGFLFSIKVPNSITLTHHYSKGKGGTLIPNPHFLSTGPMERFLQVIEPMSDHIGPLILQAFFLSKMLVNELFPFIPETKVEESCRMCRLRENLMGGSNGQGLEAGLSAPHQSFTRLYCLQE